MNKACNRWQRISNMLRSGTSFLPALAMVLGLAVSTAQTAQAQVFTDLASFTGANGSAPTGILVQATDGYLYGTASSGGANSSGTVFKISPTGGLTTLYSFCSQSGCADGASPGTGLVQASNGNLYGTTYGGGTNGAGTIFKITPNGALTTLYSFCQLSDCTDGRYPQGALVQAINGVLYGTTGHGGANGYGSVFKITPGGTLTTLHSFTYRDGASPFGVVLAPSGFLYGAAFSGGANGYGTVYRITTSGVLTTLHSFNGADGANPGARLLLAANGEFYGTTNRTLGAPNTGGTVFAITTKGALTTLYRFCSQINCTDGNIPSALIQAANGAFYGITYQGGATGDGTVFEIDSSGTLTTLYSFCAQTGCPDGAGPFAGLTQDTNGGIYGTTKAGGSNGDGTIFSLFVGLAPFVQTQTASGKVGAAVKILGSSLTGSTSVTFNGTAATFRVVSASEITTTVPAGSTSGTVAVTTPAGTFNSNKSFVVTP